MNPVMNRKPVEGAHSCYMVPRMYRIDLKFKAKYICTSSAKQMRETSYFSKIDARGSVYEENRMGPRTEP